MVYLSVVYHKIVWNFNATSGLFLLKLYAGSAKDSGDLDAGNTKRQDFG